VWWDFNYQREGNHSFVNGEVHKCTVGQGESGGKDKWIPMTVRKPNLSWGVWRKDLIKIKGELVKLGTSQWHNLRGCGKEC
jgi:hypothetical protein